MNYYLDVLKKYADFNGRARRKEYWMFLLCNAIVSVVLWIVMGMMISSIEGIGTMAIVMSIYGAAMFLPTLALTVRRLHDIGKSGAWYFIQLVPFIGNIWMFILMITEGQPTENIYGGNPKAIDMAA